MWPEEGSLLPGTPSGQEYLGATQRPEASGSPAGQGPLDTADVRTRLLAKSPRTTLRPAQARVQV